MEENLITNNSTLVPEKIPNPRIWNGVNLAYSIISLLMILYISLISMIVFLVIGVSFTTSPDSFKLPAQDIFGITSGFSVILIILVIVSIIQLVFAIKEFKSSISFKGWALANFVFFLFYSAIVIYLTLKQLNSIFGYLSLILVVAFFYLLKVKSGMKNWILALAVIAYLSIVISIKFYFSLM
jgi:hypothetical protein